MEYEMSTFNEVKVNGLSLFQEGTPLQWHIQGQQDPDMTSAPPFEILHFLCSASYKVKQAAFHPTVCVYLGKLSL